MTKRLFSLMGLVILSSLLLPLGAYAQDEAPSVEDVLKRSWNREAKKVLAMAQDEEFPADKFDTPTTEGAQTYSDLLWHCVGSLHGSAARMNGMSRDESRAAAQKRERPSDSAGMADALEKALADFNAAAEKGIDARMIGGFGHLAEQYGKLVGVYRAFGIVPPNSRR